MAARAIIHVDMDAFYASVEQRDRPSLRGVPLIVGGDPRRGVVLAASYEVRPFGVRSAMSMARARRLAPGAVVVRPRPEAYVEASERVRAIFESVTPLIEPLSLDEAFLDVTASVGLLGAPAKIAADVRARIARDVGLPASAGIAAVKFVAKLASDLAKPNGQVEVPAEDTERFLAPLPVWRLWGVGPRTDEAMKALGLRTIGDVAARDPEELARALGNAGRRFWELARGVDPRSVVPDRDAKSLGAEDTFEDDLWGARALEPRVHSQALRVGRRLRRAGLEGAGVVLKVKYADFTLVTRRTMLPEPTDDGQALYRAAAALLARVPLDRAVRLTGVAAHALAPVGRQRALFDAAGRRATKLNAALDAIAARFGGDAVVPADVAAAEGRASTGGDDDARRRVGAARFDTRKK